MGKRMSRQKNNTYIKVRPKGKRVIAQAQNVALTETVFYVDRANYDDEGRIILDEYAYYLSNEISLKEYVEQGVRIVKRFLGFDR